MRSILITIALVLCISRASGQITDEISIRILQDSRETGSAELMAYLRSPDARHRELALLAFANIQDTAAYEAIVPLLNDSQPAVRSMAAFALGMLGKSIAADPLFARLSAERDVRCREAILDAIGLCGTADALARLVTEAATYPESWNPSIVQSIARFANRKITDTDATRLVVSLLEDTSCLTGALYAVLRINDATVMYENRRTLSGYLDHPAPDVRMWSAAALRSVDDAAIKERLLICAEEDTDWRVRVNAVTALRASHEAKDRILKLAIDPNGHVSLAAVTAYDVLTRNETRFTDSTILFSLLSSPQVSPLAREEIRKIIAGKMGERAIPTIGEWRSDQQFISAQRVKAYGAVRSAQSVQILRNVLTQSKQSIVTIAAVESYQSIVRGWPEEEQEKFLEAIVPLLDNHDAGISYTVALAFQDTSVQLSLRRKFLPSLIRAYTAMDASVDLEPMIELLKIFGGIPDTLSLPAIQKGLGERDDAIRTAARQAYAAVTGTDSVPSAEETDRSYRPFYRRDDTALLGKYSGARIRTTQGTFAIRFEKDFAPLTVLNFIMLAQKGFYDGLYFHRVVSNFVIQGGDPLGNGSGGPHYAIRTEVHPHARYVTGAVGMASAGKDTEGSQWFVTHAPTPHLDYRYTIFGYTDDWDIVDRIMIGDKIESIELF